MIRHLEEISNAQLLRIRRFCERTCIGVRAEAPLLSYGTGYDFADFWVQTSGDVITAFISKFYGSATICTGADAAADKAEIELFINAIGCKDIVSDFPLVTAVTSITQKSAFTGGHIMMLETGALCTAQKTKQECEIKVNTEFKDFFLALSRNYPESILSGYDEWYVDISHRVRHGCAATAFLECGGKAVATAAALAITEGAVLLGAVSTDENRRGQGLAHTLLKYFAEQYKDRRLYIMCKPDKVGFYEKAGFVSSGNFYNV